MTTEIAAYREGYRFYCRFSKDYFGPHFKKKGAILAFNAWFDGDPRLVGTKVDEHNTWPVVIGKWTSTTEDGKLYANSVVFLDS